METVEGDDVHIVAALSEVQDRCEGDKTGVGMSVHR